MTQEELAAQIFSALIVQRYVDTLGDAFNEEMATDSAASLAKAAQIAAQTYTKVVAATAPAPVK
jgi:hypothetical protein